MIRFATGEDKRGDIALACLPANIKNEIESVEQQTALRFPLSVLGVATRHVEFSARLLSES